MTTQHLRQENENQVHRAYNADECMEPVHDAAKLRYSWPVVEIDALTVSPGKQVITVNSHSPH
jgi:hypothetical protein